MTSSDVPTATGMGRPPSRTSAGTIKNPPPAPTSPVTSPTTTPSTSTRTTGSSVCAGLSGVRRPRIIAAAVASIMSANATSKTVPGMNSAIRPPAYAPAIPAAPNSRPVRQRTRAARACAINATALVVPTTSRDVAMASLASIPAT